MSPSLHQTQGRCRHVDGVVAGWSTFPRFAMCGTETGAHVFTRCESLVPCACHTASHLLAARISEIAWACRWMVAKPSLPAVMRAASMSSLAFS